MERKDFWDAKHGIDDSYWLTGSNAQYIFNLHDLQNIRNMKVLDLGTGLGVFTKELYLLNNEVFAADISDIALQRVKGFSKTYNTLELNQIEPVDLAICTLVFQHCNDREIERIINDVKLKDNGIFSFQFAFIRDNEIPNELLQKFINEGTHYFRSLDKIMEIIKSSNKKLLSVSSPIHYYGSENCSWYVVKVINK